MTDPTISESFSPSTSCADDLTCDFCGKALGDQYRYVLSDEVHSIDFCNPTLPAIDPPSRELLGNFCSRDHAKLAAEQLIAEIGFKLNWPNVDQVLKCEMCWEDFPTSAPHVVMTLAVEHGIPESHKTLDAEEIAHFCLSCMPVREISKR